MSRYTQPASAMRFLLVAALCLLSIAAMLAREAYDEDAAPGRQAAVCALAPVSMAAWHGCYSALQIAGIFLISYTMTPMPVGWAGSGVPNAPSAAAAALSPVEPDLLSDRTERMQVCAAASLIAAQVEIHWLCTHMLCVSASAPNQLEAW